MNTLFDKLTKENKPSVISGDFNLNLIKYTQNRGINQFLEIILSSNFISHINPPTRVTEKSATFIDNIFTNNYKHNCVSGNITTYIFDHLPQFLIIEDLKQTPSKEILTISFRDYKNFSDDDFKAELSELDWSLVTENGEVNLGFETFVRLVNRILYKHAPTKITDKKENKITSKPWVTRGIKTLMKIRVKFYKQMIKTKSKQQQLSKHDSNKKYRNKVSELLKISRQTYYQKHFEKNKKNSKRIRQGIHEIISSRQNKKGSSISTIIVDGNTITAPTEMTENFNSFFTSIGKNLKKKIPPTKKTFTDYLKTPNLENFTISLTSADEISDLICSLDSNKSVGPCSIPTKILKIATEIVSLPLSELIYQYL